MRNSWQVAAACALFALVASRCEVQERNTPPLREQTHFSAEDEAVNQPVTIPDDAWAQLKADEDVRNVLESEGLGTEQLPRSWFSAAVVHLHVPQEKDLVVLAEGKLVGGNIAPFWVFLETSQGMKLVAHASTHDLIIQSNRWHGYRTIEIIGMACCTVSEVWLRCDGEKYTDYRHLFTNSK